MSDVFAIREKDGGITRLTTQSALGMDLVIDRSLLDEANRQIAKLYGIPKLEHRKPSPPVGPFITNAP